ncbi:uncharacterized protein LOC142829163 [Pelodiscus sinensis]|uniref:uncharacterized protein LOC142829163 n=1 Tax=Pelodiscus sinensis TaxID=13735 RepID=UPI003F6CEF83
MTANYTMSRCQGEMANAPGNSQKHMLPYGGDSLHGILLSYRSEEREWIKNTHRGIIIWKEEVAGKRHLNQSATEDTLSEVTAWATCSRSYASSSNNGTRPERTSVRHEPGTFADIAAQRADCEQRRGQLRGTARGAGTLRKHQNWLRYQPAIHQQQLATLQNTSLLELADQAATVSICSAMCLACSPIVLACYEQQKAGEEHSMQHLSEVLFCSTDDLQGVNLKSSFSPRSLAQHLLLL